MQWSWWIYSRINIFEIPSVLPQVVKNIVIFCTLLACICIVAWVSNTVSNSLIVTIHFRSPSSYYTVLGLEYALLFSSPASLLVLTTVLDWCRQSTWKRKFFDDYNTQNTVYNFLVQWNLFWHTLPLKTP